MNDAETYIKLKYFPIIVNREYLKTLPDYVLYKLYCNLTVGTIIAPPNRDETISRIILNFWLNKTIDKYLDNMVRRMIKDTLIEYHSNEELLYGNNSYFTK